MQHQTSGAEHSVCCDDTARRQHRCSLASRSEVLQVFESRGRSCRRSRRSLLQHAPSRRLCRCRRHGSSSRRRFALRRGVLVRSCRRPPPLLLCLRCSSRVIVGDRLLPPAAQRVERRSLLSTGGPRRRLCCLALAARRAAALLCRAPPSLLAGLPPASIHVGRRCAAPLGGCRLCVAASRLACRAVGSCRRLLLAASDLPSFTFAVRAEGHAVQKLRAGSSAVQEGERGTEHNGRASREVAAGACTLCAAACRKRGLLRVPGPLRPARRACRERPASAACRPAAQPAPGGAWPLAPPPGRPRRRCRRLVWRREAGRDGGEVEPE